MLVLFVLNQRVFERRGHTFTATSKLCLNDKTSLIDQCLAPGVATAQCNYGVEFVAATKDLRCLVACNYTWSMDIVEIRASVHER